MEAAVLPATLIEVGNHGPDQRRETLSGLAGAAAFGISAWIGTRRANACREAQGTTLGEPNPRPPFG